MEIARLQGAAKAELRRAMDLRRDGPRVRFDLTALDRMAAAWNALEESCYRREWAATEQTTARAVVLMERCAKRELPADVEAHLRHAMALAENTLAYCRGNIAGRKLARRSAAAAALRG